MLTINLFRQLHVAKSIVLLLAFLLVNHAYAATDVVIGIVVDGPVKREMLQINQIISEVKKLTSREFNVRFPEQKRLSGNWQMQEINQQIETLLNDPEVDLIITNGLLSSHQAGQIESLNKAVIAPVVADHILQELPYVDGRSGKSNYVYINEGKTVEDDLRQFHALHPFKHLAIVVDRLFLEALPELRGTTYEVQKELGFELSFLPVSDDPASALNALPETIDAVYVPPLFRFDKETFTRFSDRLIQLKLPSFSLFGREELEMGLLATTTGRDTDSLKYARRIALYVQSILLGANAGDLKVDLDRTTKLAINMRTAKAIGFSPKWRFLEVADLLHQDELDAGPLTTIVTAIRQAIESNLSLQVDRLNVDLAGDNVTNARSGLLPQISIGAGVTQLDKNRAGLTQAEVSSDADINASQLIYSESVVAGYQVAKFLEQSEDAALKTNVLDITSSSASAYIQLLLAYAREKIQLSNVKVTETNLELAESRYKIGYSDRSDALRWKSELATARQNLYAARAVRRQADTELKRQMNLPLVEKISVTDEGISELLALLASDQFQRFFDNPFSFEVFTEFEVERALKNSPELEQIGYVLNSNERELLAAKRSYYVPDVSLNANYGRNINRSGVGNNNTNLNDDEWSVGVEASIPIFAGGARRAEVSRASHALSQNRYQRDDIRQRVESRVRQAIQTASGSFPAIRLSRDAASAAEENLSLVIDSYSKGIVSITDLINAQDAALAANLSAAEAEYTFMLDWIEIQRAVANFDLLLTEDGFDNWYRELDVYYSQLNQ